ncbi:hypothetical protein ASF98_18465 [Arthrobacter sp. Leaf337]|nr:hypothetical protein ASF98_18465 [Arthrobacter sp. Leaf337]
MTVESPLPSELWLTLCMITPAAIRATRNAVSTMAVVLRRLPVSKCMRLMALTSLAPLLIHQVVHAQHVAGVRGCEQKRPAEKCLGRLYSLWLEATGDGQAGGEEGSGVDVPLDGGDIPGQGGDLPSVGADSGVGWGGFDGFGGFGSFGG